MAAIVALVCFVVIMLMWFLLLLGAVPEGKDYGRWLAFLACLILGLVVFLIGGVVVVRAP